MEFDLLIVTRNRKDVLAISLPLMLSQDRLPQRLIIVDSSDNHQEVVDQILEKTAKVNTDVVIKKAKPGIAYQRNLGLEYVQSPIVFNPDDDSLWFPGYADAVMQVYEQDTEEKIGLVCGAESQMPPPGTFSDSMPYELRWLDTFSFQHRTLNNILGYLFHDPIIAEHRTRLEGRQFPAGVNQQDICVCSYFSGFKASFRSQAVKDLRYDENLGRYSLYEDWELLLRLLHTHIPATAKRARVYHYRSPEQRTGGIEWGVITILNRAYIVCKHCAPGSPGRRNLRKFSFYLLLRSLTQIHTRYGRQRVIGNLRAMACVPGLLKAGPDQLQKLYVQLRKQCLGKMKEGRQQVGSLA